MFVHAKDCSLRYIEDQCVEQVSEDTTVCDIASVAPPKHTSKEKQSEGKRDIDADDQAVVHKGFSAWTCPAILACTHLRSGTHATPGTTTNPTAYNPLKCATSLTQTSTSRLPLAMRTWLGGASRYQGCSQ